MFDAHVKAAEKATQEFYREMGLEYSLEVCAEMFREAAEFWSENKHELDEPTSGPTDEQIEELADQFFYEQGQEQ